MSLFDGLYFSDTCNRPCVFKYMCMAVFEVNFLYSKRNFVYLLSHLPCLQD